MSSKITLQKEDIFTQSLPPSGSITLGANNDGILYRIDEHGDISPINYGVVGLTGSTGDMGDDGIKGPDSTFKFSTNSYEMGGNWYPSTAFYGFGHEAIGYLGGAPYYGLTASIKNYIWMYEHILDVATTVTGIGAYLGAGQYKMFIYDSTYVSSTPYPSTLLIITLDIIFLFCFYKC